MVAATMTLPASRSHGGDGERVARALGLDPASILDLSQSLNPVAPDPRDVVGKHLDAIARYPDPAPAHRALAEAMSVDPDRLLVTNGGAEAIALVAGLLGGSVDEPEFSLHPRDGGPRWRSNPHSPSGLLAPREEHAGVWDEAFYALATGEWTRGDDAVVVGSLTKVLACPGLRIGYVLAKPSFIAQCRRRQPEWSLNGLAAAALPDLLSALDLADSVRRIRLLREEMRTMLEGHGIAVRPSDANWLLVDYPQLREKLAPKGIVVRDCASFGLEGIARIAVPNEAGLARLADAFETLRRN